MRWMVAAFGFALGGCESSHSFRLEDLRQLTPGESTKQDLDRIFGPTGFVAYHLYSSWEVDRTPPFPLSFLTWPLFLQTHGKGYEFAVRLDSRNVMVSGDLQVAEVSSTSIFCLFGPSDYTVHLEEEELRLLRELQKKGIEVKIGTMPIRCFGGIIGWVTKPLDEYLNRH
jgi:hypothetical protein